MILELIHVQYNRQICMHANDSIPRCTCTCFLNVHIILLSYGPVNELHYFMQLKTRDKTIITNFWLCMLVKTCSSIPHATILIYPARPLSVFVWAELIIKPHKTFYLTWLYSIIWARPWSLTIPRAVHCGLS